MRAWYLSKIGSLITVHFFDGHPHEWRSQRLLFPFDIRTVFRLNLLKKESYILSNKQEVLLRQITFSRI
ncbi:hypothetical protein [Crocosphaera chwakensis]|uniref:hypothetical protein n=1 Tax=Crocosphaera chwakensis TaxID=2546361 RepID=UPI0002F67552|nr:hypothetical protein [Crocosphaera chwakensis]